MERGHGTQGTESQHEEDKAHGLRSGLDLLRDSGAFPCAVCRSGVSVNSIECVQCMYWVHNKCSGVRGRLAESYDIKPVRKEEGKSYWKIPLCDDDATGEK